MYIQITLKIQIVNHKICEGCVQVSSVSEENFAKAPLVLADGNIPTQSLGNSEHGKHTVQTVDLILPCIERIPQLHSCIGKGKLV